MISWRITIHILSPEQKKDCITLFPDVGRKIDHLSYVSTNWVNHKITDKAFIEEPCVDIRI